jgi:hypothetical protein
MEIEKMPKSFFCKNTKKNMQPKFSTQKPKSLHLAAKRIFRSVLSELFRRKMKIGHF